MMITDPEINANSRTTIPSNLPNAMQRSSTILPPLFVKRPAPRREKQSCSTPDDDYSVTSMRTCASSFLGEEDTLKKYEKSHHRPNQSMMPMFQLRRNSNDTGACSSTGESSAASDTKSASSSSANAKLRRLSLGSSSSLTCVTSSKTSSTTTANRNVYADLVQRSGSAVVKAHLARMREICEQQEDQSNSNNNSIAPPEAECRVLALLAHDVYYKVIIAKYDGIAIILKAMRLFGHNHSSFEKLCAELLGELVEHSERNRQLIQELSGDEIMGILAKHLDPETMHALFPERAGIKYHT
jgi:hypothetical protein